MRLSIAALPVVAEASGDILWTRELMGLELNSWCYMLMHMRMSATKAPGARLVGLRKHSPDSSEKMAWWVRPGWQLMQSLTPQTLVSPCTSQSDR